MGRERTQHEAQRKIVVGRLDELAPAIAKKGTDVAIFEAPQHPLATQISRLNMEIERTLDAWFGEMKDRSTTDSAAYRRVVEGAQSRVGRAELSLSAEDAALLARILEEIVTDIESLLRQFPKYTIGTIAIKTGEGSKTTFNRQWHTDDDGKNRDWLHVVRTYVGPSTEYADDPYISQADTHRDGSICVHKSTVWHRGPDRVDSVNRFAIVIRLKPNVG